MRKFLAFAALALVLIVVLYPVYQVLILALMPTDEIAAYVTQVENPANRFAPGYFLPRYFSHEQFRESLDARFLRALYVSLLFTVTVALLQFVFAFILGFVFAKIRFAGREILFFLFVAAMVLPFHVTLVPLHQILHHLEMFDTPWAVILPAIFSPLGVFLFRQFISQVPDDVLEAATIDGAGLLCILRSFVLPLIKNGAVTFFIITIVMQWSAIEGALAFIRTDEWRPMALLLREYMATDPATMFAPAVLYMLPILTVYAVLAKKSKI
ncbi:MAG: carbohydrate ABC transporter permease [Defluviitaleaceae bacterium]|nr:carbohydrate ABC transporter permease [Defluviitaleaceae bacterium]